LGIERRQMLLRLRHFGRGQRTIVRIKRSRAKVIVCSATRRVRFQQSSDRVVRFRDPFRDATLLIKHSPAFEGGPGPWRFGARIAQQLLVLRVGLRMVPVVTLRSLARSWFKAATASARWACRSRDSSTAMTSPALTTLFFNSAIFLICALIFAPTSDFSRGQMVPTATIWAAMESFSALATLTLTTGAAV